MYECICMSSCGLICDGVIICGNFIISYMQRRSYLIVGLVLILCLYAWNPDNITTGITEITNINFLLLKLSDADKSETGILQQHADLIIGYMRNYTVDLVIFANFRFWDFSRSSKFANLHFSLVALS